MNVFITGAIGRCVATSMVPISVCAPMPTGRWAGSRRCGVGEDEDLVGRLLAARRVLAWETRIPVRTSDRRDCRVRGGLVTMCGTLLRP
jgi:hypothetical protein